MTMITLSKTYTAHEQEFSRIEFREPSGVEYWSIGKVEEWQPLADGDAALLRHPDRIKSYAEELMVLPQQWGTTPAAMLAVLNLADTLKVEREVRRFFSEAEKSSSPPTSSSGAPEKGSVTSEA